MAGALILIGQVADAVASPVVGFQSDKTPDCFIFRYGRRKTWHLLGVIMNTVSVPIVYNTPCFPGNCESSSTWARFAYYAFMIIIFQAGWAATQVSHVSLIVDLTQDTNERIALNAYRQAATIGANICLYSVMLGVIGFGSTDTFGQKDLEVITKVSYIVCGIGIIFSILFHVFIREPDNLAAKPRKVRPSVFTVETKRIVQQSRGSTTTMTLLAQNQPDTDSSGRPSICALPEPMDQDMERYLKSKAGQKRWTHWLKSLNFWKITAMYTMARMFVNLSQVYIPLYLQDTLQMPKNTIAIIPFATYVAGLVCSFAAKPLSARLGTRWVLLIGTAFGVASCVWMWIGNDSAAYKSWQVYGVSAFIGIGGTALLIASLSLTSDLIGSNTATGAFVFAAMSFFDKSINGLVIALLEHFNPKNLVPGEPVDYYKLILIFITGCSSLIILAGLLSILKTRYGLRAPKMGGRTNNVQAIH
ncbi:major facilitator superfamily domain-containing protein 12-like [Oppia nitens]|uniref:major facilitator superfamily domain-containing protein 12-like n=1 Tax=Oppia nitens TaxID=1686743 RepID=UPI0023DA9EB4|nr:major facilitator superfamily domain-containing protein 12-like [Oppia nitens]